MKRWYFILIIIAHLLFWILNYLLVGIYSGINWNGFSTVSGSFQYAYSYGLLLNALLFYSQIFWFFPKLYIKRRRYYYWLVILTIFLISIAEAYLDQLLLLSYGITDEPFLGSLSTILFFHLIYSVAGFFYKLRSEYKKSEKIRQQLTEESHKTELKYLRAQLNPHFLFNGINSVYHLIGKDNDLAKDTLLQFSGLLRYQLYESSTSISLERELDYVSQYIKIEETRRGSDIKLHYDIVFENSDKEITPLLLIPFIENAFKHCSNYDDGNRNIISIKIQEIGGELTLNVTNSFDRLYANNAVGGIGLNNVKRRLSLLYPDNHILNISNDNANFVVSLSINL